MATKKKKLTKKPIRKIIPPTTFTSKKYPKFIRSNEFLKTNPKLPKIFPLIGLKNQSLPLADFLSDKDKKNLPHLTDKKYRIVFSSNSWDIATMSMRGTSSCQSWSGSFKACLIGSIADPCCGIIYLTDGSRIDKGEQMLYRSVVRFVLNRSTWKPQIVYDEYYGKSGTMKLFENRSDYGYYFEIGDIFEQALIKMMGKSALTVKHASYAETNHCIPFSPQALNYIAPKHYSYRDSCVDYWMVKPTRLPKAARQLDWGIGLETRWEAEY